MKRLASSLILLLAIIFGAPLSVNAGDIELTRKWELYQIKGRNQYDLRKAMNIKGPVNADTGVKLTMFIQFQILSKISSLLHAFL